MPANEQLLLSALGYGSDWLAALACCIVVDAPQQNCGR
jgi:hypothetical protein